MKNRSLKMLFHVFFILALTSCQNGNEPPKKSSVLRVSMEGDPQTLDPRKVRDLSTATVIHMLYEGLMRHDPEGKPALALAEKVSISEDQKTYTFTLRKSAWSDSSPVTASDFAETWKSLLHPEFPSPNAYQLYAIKGARAAKEGIAPIDQIGVKALDPSTLTVELEEATPYFLSLAATHFYYPVHASMRNQTSENNPVEERFATNGPFMQEKWQKHNEFTSIPNPHYWDRSNVRLDRISLIVLDNPTALQLFKNGELDWTGSPLSTLSIDALASLKQEGVLEIAPAAGVYLFRLNTKRPPLDSPKIRQALSLAINRSALVEHVLQGNQEPAFGIIPPSFLNGKPYFKDSNGSLARKLFQQALDEQGISKNELPPIALYYANGERSHKIAQVVQQQWKKELGIDASLQSNEPKVYFDRLKQQDYQVGLGSWFADFRDPISFLEIFKRKDNGTNNTQWEDPRYVALIDQSSHSENREALLKQAERLLIKEMPVIPLFFASYNYVKDPSVKGVSFSELGYLDFKNAYLDHEN